MKGLEAQEEVMGVYSITIVICMYENMIEKNNPSFVYSTGDYRPSSPATVPSSF